jgi:hypothetical protein
MPNTISVLNPANWRPIVQDFLNNILIATDIANTQVRAELVDGDTVNFPQMSDLRVQDYAQGTDLTIDNLNAAQSQLLVNQSRVVTMAIDPVQEKQAKAKYGIVMAKQAAFRLANDIDKKLLSAGVAGAYTSTTLTAALTTPTLLSNMNDQYAKLFRRNATDGEVFAVIDAERRSLLTQTFIANGFVQADNSLQHQYQGFAAGFKIYVSNNLPSSTILTLDTNPTAGNTITLYGVTWTIVANGTAANAGDISLGGNIGTTQPIVVTAINGTGTTGASYYVDVSVDDRRILQNNDVSCTSFGTPSANRATITAAGRIAPSLVMTAGTNVFSAETTSMLFGKVGAISLGMQMMPNLYIREEPKQLARNYLTHTLYGCKVFTRDAYRLSKLVIPA